MKNWATAKAMQEDGYSLLILGLVQLLPPAVSGWSQADRQMWLDATKAVFELVYKTAAAPAQ